jgi:hypothetical protein
MIKHTALALPILGVIMALALASPASADIINLSLATPLETTTPGIDVSFVATVSAPVTNLADVFLNADSNGAAYPVTVDDTPFLFNFPFFLAPGQSFTGILFTADVPSFTALYTDYPGFFELQGGADSNAADDLGTVTFTVSTTPEPQGAILLLVGLSGLALALRRKHRLN